MDVNVHSDEALLSSGGRLGRRRRWSSAEKRQIVEESLAGNRQASLTARRHGIPHSLLFRWRKAYQEGRLGESDEPVSFMSATVMPDVQAEPDAAPGQQFDDPCDWDRRMEIVVRGGRRVIVGPAVEPGALRRVLTVLEAL
jgi:transposase